MCRLHITLLPPLQARETACPLCRNRVLKPVAGEPAAAAEEGRPAEELPPTVEVREGTKASRCAARPSYDPVHKAIAIDEQHASVTARTVCLCVGQIFLMLVNVLETGMHKCSYACAVPRQGLFFQPWWLPSLPGPLRRAHQQPASEESQQSRTTARSSASPIAQPPYEVPANFTPRMP